MKREILVKTKKVVNLKTLRIDIRPHWFAQNERIPLVKYNEWKVNVDIDTGRIQDWPTGETEDIFWRVKVNDGDCRIDILDDNGEVIKRYKGIIPRLLNRTRVVADYLDIEITSDGYIDCWNSDNELDFLLSDMGLI